MFGRLLSYNSTQLNSTQVITGDTASYPKQVRHELQEVLLADGDALRILLQTSKKSAPLGPSPQLERELVELALRCSSSEERARPSMGEVVKVRAR